MKIQFLFLNLIMFSSFLQLSFFTVTNVNWLPLLKDDKNKMVIVDSLSYMVKNNRCRIFGFVIMHNHIHLLLELCNEKESTFQRDFLKFTSQKCILYMKDKKDPILTKIKSRQKDRKLQFWERRSLWLTIHSEEALVQKLAYIHNNPVNHSHIKSPSPKDYKWSSAKSYIDKSPQFDFLTLIGLPEEK